MALIGVKLTCDWPGCKNQGELDRREDGTSDWKNWRSVGHELLGPFMCPAHATKTADNLKAIRERIREAPAVAAELVAEIDDPTKLNVAAAMFNLLFPGCESIWRKAMQHG